MDEATRIKEEGPLGVLLVGLGAVCTTLVAGIEAVHRGLAAPLGSLTQMGHLNDEAHSALSPALGLAHPRDLRFLAWDVCPDSAYEAARKAGVLPERLLEELKEPLEALRPCPAVVDGHSVPRLGKSHRKQQATLLGQASELRADIENFKTRTGADRLVMVLLHSTEISSPLGKWGETREAFERALETEEAAITAGMVYAWVAVQLGIPVINATPAPCLEWPALQEEAERKGIPLCGKDLKTGQTLLKTVIAPGLKARMLGIRGWYSANILGNRDGEVLDDPAAAATKVKSKLSVLDGILEPHLYPDLYGDLHHQVRIDYYPPRRDEKEAWDNIDITGWLGMPMQIKVNFLCRDSILAAPLVLDLLLLLDRARRAGARGFQNWLSFYFKSPLVSPGEVVEHDLFRQKAMLDEGLLPLRLDPAGRGEA